MACVVVRLDPKLLSCADADLRYEIPDLLASRNPRLLRDAGYDYESDGHAIQIYLETPDLAQAVPLVVAFLESEQLHGNDLSAAAAVGVSPADPGSASTFEVVYPSGRGGIIEAPTP